MSKKKMPRAVMTLKDFHGGSIPSDLPLPSAPGMTVDRSAYERQSSGAWSSPTLGRGYGSNDRGVNHFRQGSGNGVRTFEDKASFFPNPANIGRNYEEDERKPVDGRPRSGPTERFEDHGYEEQRPRSSYEKTVDRFSMDEQGGYAPASRSDRIGRVDSGTYGQGDGQGYRQQTATPYASEPVAPVSRNQSSYTQASQHSMLHARPASPPGSWRQQTQQPTAAAAVRGSGVNVWPARQDSQSARTAEPVQVDSRSTAPWRAQSSTVRPDIAPVEKLPQGRWQSESEREGPVHVPETKPVRGPGFTEPNIRRPGTELSPPAYASDRPQVPDTGRVEYGAQGGQGNFTETGRAGYVDGGRGGYMETSRPFSDSGRRSFTDGYTDGGGRGTYQEPSRGGYVDDGGRRRVMDERSLGYDEPLRSGNSERITFSDSGRPIYPEGGRYVGEPNRGVDYSENGRPEYRDIGRSEYLEAGREREAYPESGRGTQDNVNRGGFNDRGRPGHGGGRGNLSESLSGSGGRSAYNVEGPRDTYAPVGGRGSYPVENPPSSTYSRNGGYGADSSVGPYSENHVRSKSPLEKPYMANGSRSPPPVESIRGGYSSSDSAPPDTSRGVAPAARAEPVAERPRLKLLPRTKPLEAATPVAAEMSEESVKEPVPQIEEKRQAEVFTLEGNDGGDNTGGNNESAEESSRVAERPKLNLKPRSQPAEAGAELIGSENLRQTVFGGARPRELVLKERGVDEPVGDVAPTPAAPVASKVERQESGRTEAGNTWGDEKQDGARRFEPRGGRSIERQDGTRAGIDALRGDPDRKESRRTDRDFDRQDSRERFDGTRSYERQDTRNRDGGDRQDPPRRDIDKQDSWRRPASPPAVTGPPTLLDSSSRQNSGRLGYTAPASAVELAQAFSRSASLGSPMSGIARTNSGNQRGPISPGIRGPSQGYSSGPINGNNGYGMKDAPFSRLAEAPPPVAGMYAPGGGQMIDRANNGYNAGRGYGPGVSEPNWVPSYGRTDDDFPGKRGLPLRRPYE